MKKIGILTFYYKGWNFGAQLQARALVRAVEQITAEKVEQIQFDYEKAWLKLNKIERVCKDAAYRGGWSHKIKHYVTYHFGKKKPYTDEQIAVDCRNREKAFLRFSQETPHSEEVYTPDIMQKTLEQYDCFICGGDQIWNDWGVSHYWCGLDAFTLNFVPENIRKFSYAPSIPLKNPKEQFAEKLGNAVKKLDAISVREKSSVPLVEGLTGRKVEVVVDPVLLLTREQWDKECEMPNQKEPYILCYILGGGTQNRLAAQKYAEQLGVKLLTFPHIVCPTKYDVGFGDVQDYSSGPAEFVGLIRNAEVVVTDSFHAAVFSMIYHKPFYVLERGTVIGGSTMGSRLMDFLEEYGLSEQWITPDQLQDKTDIPQIDYTEADRVLGRRRMESYEYLKRNLKRNSEEKFVE